MKKSLTLKIILPLIAVSLVATLFSFTSITKEYALEDFRELIAILFTQVLVITVVTFYLIDKIIIRRIDVFKDIIRKRAMGIKGLLVEVGDGDEIFDLSCAFNQMIEGQDQYEYQFRENERKLKLNNEFISHGMEASQVGLWQWNFKTDTIWFSPYLKEMLGYKEHELENEIATFDKIIHPEDKAAAQKLMGECKRTGRNYEKLSKFFHKDGSIRFIICRAKFSFEDGAAVRAVGSHTDVTELQRAIETNKVYTKMLEQQTIELEKSKNMAEDAAKLKSEFLANMSHEIRTPMNGVLGMANILSKTNLDTDQKSYLKTMINSAESLLEIVNDILDFSKIEAGKVTLESVPFDLQSLVEDVADMIAYKTQEKKLELITRFAPSAPRAVIGDPARIRQIFINLLSNALKFTNEGHIAIDVRAAEVKDGVAILRCSVKDTGIGIPADKVDKIFNKFDQADTSTTRKFGGTGLGLAICKEIAHMMGGDVGVYSTPGAGSNFWFTIKLKLDETATRPVEKIYPALKGIKLMVVDDNVTSQNALLEQAESFGAHTFAANSVRNVIKVMTELENAGEKLDAAIIALGQNSSDNPKDIARGLKDKNKSIALIYVSASPFKGEKTECEKSGYKGYFTRPIHYDALKAGLNKLITAAKEKRDMPFVTIHTFKEEKGEVKDMFRNSEKLKGKDILVVDDNEVNRLVVVKMLEKFGVNMETANDGGEAVGKVKRKKFDLIFMDCQMPNMDGYEATKVIREVEKANRQMHTPIVALTAHAVKGDDEKCFAAGMDDYLAKPVKTEHIEEKLLKWLAS
jgi:PAS domain S-box-containing protein